MIIQKRKREYSDYQKKLQRYYRIVFISEFSKIGIFFIIFSLVGLLPEYIIALFALSSLRSNGGGLHFNHYTTCLIVSFLFIFSSIYLAITFRPSQAFISISILVCIIIAYLLVPITSTNRPPATDIQVRKSKRNTTVMLLLYLTLLFFFSNTTGGLICYWTIILHILQLIIAYVNYEFSIKGTVSKKYSMGGE